MPTAYIAHALPGRARIKIPAKRGDGLFFAQLQSRLQACAAVQSVEVNDRSASLLVTHEGPADLRAIAAFARQHQLFSLDGVEALPLPSVGAVFLAGLQQADRTIRQTNQLVAQGSHGRLDLQSLFFLLFFGLGLARGLRGFFAKSDVSLLWRVVELMKAF